MAQVGHDQCYLASKSRPRSTSKSPHGDKSQDSTRTQASPDVVENSYSSLPELHRHMSRNKSNMRVSKANRRKIVAVGLESRARTSRSKKSPSSPESAQEIEIETSQATMSELCKDSHQGRKSKRESLLECIDWDEVKRRKQQERDRGQDEIAEASVDREATPQPLGPQMRVVNNEFVLDETTQVIDDHAKIIEEANVEAEALDESNLTKRVNQATIGHQKSRSGIRWDEENTQRFYEGLRLFGTDLSMIGNQVFHGISRDHLKRKYLKEEHENPELLRRALTKSRKARGRVALQAVRDLEYEDPAQIYADLAAIERDLEEDYAKEQEDNANGGRRKKKRQNQEAEVSTNGQFGDSSLKENKHDGEIRRNLEEVVTNRRGKLANTNKKITRTNKRADVGTEEILGSVEDIQ